MSLSRVISTMRGGTPLSSNSIACLALLCWLRAATAQAGIVAHWKFDETEGRSATDSAGSRHGTLSATGAKFVTGGISGNALLLSPAENGFVSMGNMLPFTSGSFTIAAWAKIAAGDETRNYVVLSKHMAFTANGYFVVINQSNSILGQTGKAAFFRHLPIRRPLVPHRFT
jgi:hypothetical protein